MAKRTRMVHKLPPMGSILAECGRTTLGRYAVQFTVFWNGTTCKNCLRHRPKRKARRVMRWFKRLFNWLWLDVDAYTRHSERMIQELEMLKAIVDRLADEEERTVP